MPQLVPGATRLWLSAVQLAGGAVVLLRRGSEGAAAAAVDDACRGGEKVGGGPTPRCAAPGSTSAGTRPAG